MKLPKISFETIAKVSNEKIVMPSKIFGPIKFSLYFAITRQEKNPIIRTAIIIIDKENLLFDDWQKDIEYFWISDYFFASFNTFS